MPHNVPTQGIGLSGAAALVPTQGLGQAVAGPQLPEVFTGFAGLGMLGPRFWQRRAETRTQRGPAWVSNRTASRSPRETKWKRRR